MILFLGAAHNPAGCEAASVQPQGSQTRCCPDKNLPPRIGCACCWSGHAVFCTRTSSPRPSQRSTHPQQGRKRNPDDKRAENLQQSNHAFCEDSGAGEGHGLACREARFCKHLLSASPLDNILHHYSPLTRQVMRPSPKIDFFPG